MLIGLFVIIALVLTRSQTETTSVQITQVSPTIDVIKLCPSGGATSCNPYTGLNGVTGSANTQTPVDVFMKISDLNGNGDIAEARVAMFHHTVIPNTKTLVDCDTAAEKDGNYCYSNYDGQTTGGISACTLDFTEGATSAWYKCSALLEYWMDSNDYPPSYWELSGIAYDSTALTGTATSSFTKNIVLSMNFGSSTISYGQMSLGATQAGISVLGTLYGNSDADMTIQASSAVMTCDGPGSANIPVSNQRFGTNDNIYELLTTSFSTTNQDLNFETSTGLGWMQHRTNENSAPTDSAYFGIQIPNSGVIGTCSVAAIVTAIAQ